MSLRNRIIPLHITLLAPLHIDTGARLVSDIDYYSHDGRSYIIDSDVALELALQRWSADRPSAEERRRQAEAQLEEEEQRLQRRRARNKSDIERFEESPPRDRDKRAQQAQKLIAEADAIKAKQAELKARRTALASQEEQEDSPLPDQLVNSSRFSDLFAAELLQPSDLREPSLSNRRPLVRYPLDGAPATDEIYAQVKDGMDRPYLPGSSLKGAIRSALAWDLVDQQDVLGKVELREAKKADDRIDRDLFLGRATQQMNSTVRDVMRLLRISDSTPLATPPTLLQVAMLGSSSQRNTRLDVEAMPEGAEVRATLQIERYGLESSVASRVIDFSDWRTRFTPEALAASCRRRAAVLIRGEQDYFASFPQAAELTRFYDQLASQLANLDARSCMLPVGWGAGWRSKTLDDRLRGVGADDQLFADIVRRFRLKKHKSDTFRPGMRFPDSRKVVLFGERPARPLGWVQISFGAEVER